MTKERPTRIGLIGAGGVVKTLHAPLLKQLDDVSLEWVYDKQLSSARQIASNFGFRTAYDELGQCSDVDAVLIAIPVGARDCAWRTAAERGWNVFCEKPAARTADELDQALQRMQRTNRAAAFGMMRRFYRGTISLRSLIEKRVFGDPLEIWAGEGGMQPRTGRGSDWYQLDSRLSGGGVLIETGSHLIDQVMFVCNATGYRLESYDQRANENSPEYDARILGRLNMTGSPDMPFSVEITRSREICNGIFVRFPQITLALPPGPGSRVEMRDQKNRLVGRVQSHDHGASTSFQAFRNEWVEFLRCCKETRQSNLAEDNRLLRLSISLIEDCYTRASTTSSSTENCRADDSQ